MKLTLITLLSLNVLVLLPSMVKTMKIVFTNNLFSDLGDEKIEVYSGSNKFYKFLTKTLVVLIVLIIGVIIFCLVTAPVWFPIVLWRYFGFNVGVIAFLIVTLILLSLKLLYFRKKDFDQTRVELGIISDILFTLILMYSLVLGNNTSSLRVQEILRIIYVFDFPYSITIISILPMLIFSLLTLNVYLVSKVIILYLRKKVPYKPTTLKEIFLVLTISSYTGLYYLNEMNTGFISLEDIHILNEASRINSSIVAIIVIPLLLNRLTEQTMKKIN